MHREVERAGGMYSLRESSEAYRREFAQENEALRSKNTIPWQKFAEAAETYPGPTRGPCRMAARTELSTM
jgi:hypothetical protein